jgi:hypothetical protein
MDDMHARLFGLGANSHEALDSSHSPIQSSLGQVSHDHYTAESVLEALSKLSAQDLDLVKASLRVTSPLAV